MSYANFKYVGQMSYAQYKAVLHPPKPILKLCIYGYYHYLKVVLKIEQSSQTDNRKKEKREGETGRSDKPINRREGVKALTGLLLGAGITAPALQASKAAHMGAEGILAAAMLAYAGTALLIHT
jgi:hypothetical protein